MDFRYYVVTADGAEQGPVDIETLVHWARLNQINAHTLIRIEGQTSLIRAMDLTGFHRGESPPDRSKELSEPIAFIEMPSDSWTKEIILAYILCSAGLIGCCVIFTPVGLYYASLALQEKQKDAEKAWQICWTLAIIQATIVILAGLAYAVISAKPPNYNW